MAKSRPLGYIFPKRIKSAIAGDWTKKTFYGGGLTKEEKEAFAEQRLKELEERNARLSVLEEARSPWICPTCEKIMRNKLDQKFFMRRGMCMSCSIKGETYLRTHGLYDKYEEGITLRNYKAYLIDIREQAIEFAANLKDEIKVVNHDGSFDTLKGNTKQVKEFILKEIEDLDKKLEEVADIDLNKSTEEELNIDLKKIVKDILMEEKNSESVVEKNS